MTEFELGSKERSALEALVTHPDNARELRRA